MTSLDALTLLLADELGSMEDELEAFKALARTSLIFDFVASQIDAGSGETLDLLCHGHTPLHDLIDRYAPPEVWIPRVPDGAPFDGCTQVEGALRAMAALGAALICEVDAIPGYLAIGTEWLRHLNSAPATAPLANWTVPRGPRRDRLTVLLGLVGAHEHGAAVMAWLVDLARQDSRSRTTATIEVLFDQGDIGVNATLRGRVLRDLPGGLAPDPRTMASFVANDDFHNGLSTAWYAASGRKGPAVLWSLASLDGTVDYVEDVSLSAAFAVLFDELARLDRRVRGPLTVRRIAASTAIVGGVDAAGRLEPVSGYATKMPAARHLDRVIVPEGNLADANLNRPDVELVGVVDWKAAAKASRKPNREVRRRIITIAVVSLLVVVVIGGALWNRAVNRQELRDVASAVAGRAYDLSNGDDEGLSLLLAMAADDIASDVDEHPAVLVEILRGNSSLRRIVRADQGVYDELAVSADGEYALLGTSTGSADLVATRTGDTMWHRTGKGVESTAGGVEIGAVAMSESGQRAAIATSDRRVLLLTRSESTWSETADIELPVEAKTGPLNVELNSVSELAFAPRSKGLVAYGSRVGLFRYDVKNPRNPPTRCAAPESGKHLFIGDDSALITTERQIVRVNLTTCAQTVEVTAPEGAFLHAGVEESGALGIATRGTQLIVLRPGQPETVLSDRGPYHRVTATVPDVARVVATTAAGTYGWKVSDRAQEFGYRGSGLAAAGGNVVVRAKGGIAEVHDGMHSPATVGSTSFLGAESVEWAGPHLVIRGSKVVWVGANARTMTGAQFAKSANFRKLDLPAGSTTKEISTSLTSPWAAVLFRAEGTRRVSMQVWDVERGQQADVVVPDDREPSHAVFADDAMYVGYLNGDVRRFRFADNAWRYVDGAPTYKRVVALAARDGRGDVYAVLSEDNAGQPSVVRIKGTDLAVSKEVPLDGGTALAKIVVLADSQVVVGNGAGFITFLSPELEVRGTYTNSTLRNVLDLTEIPGRRTVAVSGVMTTTFLDTVDRTPRADFWGGGLPFGSMAAAQDDRLLATYNRWGSDLALWSLESSDLRGRMCAAVGRDLSPEEWTRLVSADLPYRSVCPS
jgi:hypothetical protein